MRIEGRVGALGSKRDGRLRKFKAFKDTGVMQRKVRKEKGITGNGCLG
jgi:hypothetical protein